MSHLDKFHIMTCLQTRVRTRAFKRGALGFRAARSRAFASEDAHIALPPAYKSKAAHR